MRFYWFVLGALGVWRITHLLQAEDGPCDIVVRLRRMAGNSFWGRVLDCFYCLSLWIAVPFAYWIGETWKERGLLWLAFSGAASLLERATAPAAAAYSEDKEEPDVLLRRTENAGDAQRRSPDSP
jgi:hypothetical protein